MMTFYCGECHGPTAPKDMPLLPLSDPNALKAYTARNDARKWSLGQFMKAGEMPPSGKVDPQDLAKMLEFVRVH